MSKYTGNSKSKQAIPLAGESETELMTLVEQFGKLLQSGESVDIPTYVSQHPEHAEKLDRLLPTVEALNAIGLSTASSGSGPGDFDQSVRRDVMRGVLGDFRIIREIGRGGMGVVYEAEQISLGRQVALKVLPFASVLDQRQLQRFKNEAQAAAGLHHTNIVPVYSVGCDRGVHYYSMQLIAGKTVAELIYDLPTDVDRNEPKQLPRSEQQTDTGTMAALSTERSSTNRGYLEAVARIGLEAANALQYAHDRGIVHRDIKPSNLIVDQQGQTWITDFGLAMTQEETGLTAAGDVLGTLRYMSPEQASGRAVLLDHRTDIYSLGITLYEMVTLRPAFPSQDRNKLLRAIAETQPPFPRVLNHAIPRDLETVVLKATSKSAELRYANARDLADDLQRFLTHQPVRARRTGKLTVVHRWARRNPWLASSILTIFLLLVVLAVGGAATSWHLTRVNRIAQRKLYIADIAQAQQAIERGDHVAAESLLGQYIPVSPQADDVREFEWFYLWNRCHEWGPKFVLDHGLNVYATKWSPDGAMLATAGFTGDIFIWDAKTGNPVRRIQEQRGWITSMQFSKDSTKLIVGGQDHRVCIWSVPKGELQWSQSVTLEGNESITSVALSPDESKVAVGSTRVPRFYPKDDPGAVQVWDLETKERLLWCTSLVGEVKVAFSPEGNFLSGVSFDGRLRLWNTETWEEMHSWQAHEAGIFSVAFAPDGQTIATGSGIWHDGFVGGELKLWHTGTWELQHDIHFGSAEIKALGYSHDGKALAIGFSDGMMAVAEPSSGILRREAVAHTGTIWDITFSPDGQSLLSGSDDNTARVWPVSALPMTSGNSSIRVRGKVNDVAFVDDDRVCAVNSYGTLYVIDINTKQILHERPNEGYWLNYLDVSPNGQMVAVVLGHYPYAGVAAKLLVYKLDTYDEIFSAELPNGFIKGLRFAPDCDSIAVASREILMIADLSRSTLKSIDKHDSLIKGLAHTPDGQRFACTCDNGMCYFYESKTHQRIHELTTDAGGNTIAIDFSPEGDFFVTAGTDRTIKTWDAYTYRALSSGNKATGYGNSTVDYILQTQVSRNGRRIVTGGKDGSVTLWDAQLTTPMITLSNKLPWITGVDYSPSGETIVASGTAELLLWNGSRRDTSRRLLNLRDYPIVCSVADFPRERQEPVRKAN